MTREEGTASPPDMAGEKALGIYKKFCDRMPKNNLG